MDAAGEATLRDLILSLTERMGWQKRPTGADNRAQIPRDPNLLDRAIRAINAGRRETYRRMSSAKCFKPRIEIATDPNGTSPECIGGDCAKYRLPYAVQGLVNPWNWSLMSNPGYGGPLVMNHSSDVATMHHTASSAGLKAPPRSIALAQQSMTNPKEPARRTATYLWLYPQPDQVYVLEGEVRVMYAPLVGMDDLEPMGQAHIDTIVIGAERDIKMNAPDLTQRAEVEQRFRDAIIASIAADNNTRPQTIGRGADPDVERQRARWMSRWPDRAAMVTHLNGNPLFPGA